ncbi:MAG TPA: cupin domain-containing protein [Sulfuricurvum sp.]|nr:cupin domain-containing protein [Sulfuricurvum sp.]
MNLYALNDPKPNTEIFQTLHQHGRLKIEAIRSHLTQPGEVYDQNEDEWVILLRGNAGLKIKDTMVHLQAGECVFLPKHTPHQVLSTSDDALWLAVFSS